MDDLRNFTILTRRDASYILEDNPANSEEYTYLASAINIALGMMEHPQARASMAELAASLDVQRGSGRHLFPGGQADAKPLINHFLGKVRGNFPIVVIDYTMTNADCLATHPRGVWHGKLGDFDPRHQMILVNGHRVRDMISAARATPAHGRFRDFQFVFAIAFFHETAAHLLYTFLSNGRSYTPVPVTVQGYSDPTIRAGESGRWLEEKLFGGTMEFYRDPTQGNKQSGVPYQLDAEGWAWKIDPNTITDFVQYNFSYPLGRVGDAVDRTTMQSMGHGSCDPPMNERGRNMMARFSAFSLDVERPEGHLVKVRDMMAVPVNPTKRLVVY